MVHISPACFPLPNRYKSFTPCISHLQMSNALHGHQLTRRSSQCRHSMSELRLPQFIKMVSGAGLVAGKADSRASLQQRSGLLERLGGAGTLSRPDSFLRRLLVKTVASVTADAEDEDDLTLEEEEDDLGEDDSLGMPRQGEHLTITVWLTSIRADK